MKRRAALGVAAALAAHVIAVGAATAAPYDPDAPPAPPAPTLTPLAPLPWIGISTSLRLGADFHDRRVDSDGGWMALISFGGPALGLSDLRIGVYGDLGGRSRQAGVTLSALRRWPITIGVGAGVRNSDGARFRSQRLSVGMNYLGRESDPSRPPVGYIPSFRAVVTTQQTDGEWSATIGAELDPLGLFALFITAIMRASGT